MPPPSRFCRWNAPYKTIAFQGSSLDCNLRYRFPGCPLEGPWGAVAASFPEDTDWLFG